MVFMECDEPATYQLRAYGVTEPRSVGSRRPWERISTTQLFVKEGSEGGGRRIFLAKTTAGSFSTTKTKLESPGKVF